MTRRTLLHAAFATALVSAGAACSPSGDSGASGATTGAIVFGVTSELRPGVDFDRLHAVLAVGGATRSDVVLSSSSSPKLAFPLEIHADDVPDGELAALTLEAFLPGTPAGGAPLLTRLASTRAKRAMTLLDRVSLDAACLPPLVGGDADAGTGDAAGPATSCTPPQTCVAGACASSYVDPQFLVDDPYVPDWNVDRPDPPCKPTPGATPEIVLGEGQADYHAIADLATLQVEKGPQGGHHVWIAVRLRNLHRSGTRTRLSAVQPESGLAVAPYETIFTLDPDEGGWCKVYGLRFQLDAGGVDFTQLLGKTLDVTATAVDVSGDHATTTKRVMLSRDFI